MKEKREKIKEIDQQILELLSHRFGLAREIAEIKKNSQVEIEDLGREKELFEFYLQLSEELGLDLEFTRELFEKIIEHSKKLQKQEKTAE